MSKLSITQYTAHQRLMMRPHLRYGLVAGCACCRWQFNPIADLFAFVAVLGDFARAGAACCHRAVENELSGGWLARLADAETARLKQPPPPPPPPPPATPP